MKRAFWKKVLALILWVSLTAYPAFCSTYFVATNGNDTTGNGTIGLPWKTISPKAVGAVHAGDTIYVRGGTYTYTGSSDAITIPAKSGTSDTNRCYLIGYNGERPLLDFTAMSNGGADGLQIDGSYWYVKGFDCKGAPHNGIQINGGSYNIIEFCSSFENRNSGVQLESGASYNQIINCDSYYNYDAPDGGDADGFSPKMDVGTGNYFYGCRSWQNSDDGYDGYLRGADDVTTTYENCWSFKNGYLKSGAESGGNGNGFKMGGSDDKTLRHNAILKRCLCFQNRVKGFDQNSDKGSMWVYNCTAYDNNSYDFSITTSPLASGKVAEVINCVSFPVNYNISSFVLKIGNSWQPPVTTTAADFVSTNPSDANGPRNPDGSLPKITFMHLVAGSDLIDHGTTYVELPYCGSAPDIGCFEYCTLTTSASAGGTVTIPGIGTYVYDFNTYANITASANANYHFVNWTGTAVTAGKVANPNAASTTVLMTDIYAVQANFASNQSQKTISGYVTELDANVPVADVNINATNGGGSDITEPNGYYQLTVNSGWSGTVTLQKTNYTFDPNGKVYNNVTSNQTDNYTALLNTFTISGYVTDSVTLAPMADVLTVPDNNGGPYTTKYFGGGTDTTDVNGFYQVLVDANWSGKVVPSKYAYAFEPNSVTYTNVIANVSDQDYAGTLLTYRISGNINNACDVPVANVLVNADNGGGSGTTDADGYYEVWVNYNWSGTVTPGKAHYTFVPDSQTYTGVTADQAGQDYTASNIYDLDCSGYIDLGDVKIMTDNWLGIDVGLVGGDFDVNGIVDFIDFADFANVWQEQ